MNPRPEWEAHLPVSVGIHVRELTQFEHHVYAEADRVTVTVAGTNNADVTLYLPRAELGRLRDALSAIADELDAQRRACDVGMTNSAA